MIRKTFITAAALAALAGGAFAQDSLRIGVEGAYPPFSFKEADGSLSGFDIEIAEALCAQMQRECELVEQEPSAPGKVHARAETAEWTRLLADAARAALPDGFPIFMGGDHALSLGTVSRAHRG